MDIQRKYDKASSFLDRFGIKIGYAEEKDVEQIINLRKQEPLLKDYHFAYETEREILDAVEKGYYRCAYNHLGEVCAVQHYTVINGILQGGWLAVNEEYKVRYGIGSAMAYHSFLKKFGTVTVDRDMVIVCVVGNLEWTNTGFETQALEALRDIPVRMISYGGSNYNISFLIRREDKIAALNRLSDCLFKNKK